MRTNEETATTELNKQCINLHCCYGFNQYKEKFYHLFSWVKRQGVMQVYNIYNFYLKCVAFYNENLGMQKKQINSTTNVSNIS